MMPMPATDSEMAAMPVSAAVSIESRLEKVASIESCVRTVTSSSSSCRAFSTVNDGALRGRQLVVRAHLDQHAEQARLVEHPHVARERNEHDLVEVHPETRAARRDHADDAETLVAEAQHLAERVALPEQLPLNAPRRRRRPTAARRLRRPAGTGRPAR